MGPKTLQEDKASGCYTALQLASALQISKRNALKALRGVVPTQTIDLGGNSAGVWEFNQLPKRWQKAIAEGSGRESLPIADYIAASARLWEPRIPFSQASTDARDKAVKRHRAFAGTMQRWNEGFVSQGEIERLGLLDYKSDFGFEISARHWRRWLKTILWRARGEKDFSRIDIYMDEDASPAKVEEPEKTRAEFRALRSLIDGILKAGNPPTAAQRRQVFDDAFQLLSVQGETVKRELVDFLCTSAPFLAKNSAALRRNFDLLYQKWKDQAQAIEALDDRRHGRPRGPQLTDEERVTLIAYSAKYGGGRNQGWREAIRANKLRAEVVNYYAKSLRRMPRKIREQITGYVDDAKMRMHGPRHAVLQGPYINRDPNHPAGKLYSGDWDQSDDYTFVNIMWDVLPDGSLYVGQPQLLLWTDERSWLPLGFVLIPDRGYNAFDIRNSWTAKCDAHGLPRKGLYLEGSFWQSARVWVGKRDEVQWSETEQGIRRLGLRITRAIYPRGKLIERVFKLLQDYLQAEPGFVGTNPITDRYETIQKQIRLARSGAAHPKEFGWLSKEEWRLRLGELLSVYSSEPMEGKYHEGLSPKQAYEAHFADPLQRVPDECRHLLACNKIEAPIRANGLRFQYGTRQFCYKDERLGKMRFANEKVIAWFNPENPEFCGVTDSNGENPIVVKRETSVPSHDAPADLMAQAQSENAAMTRHAKEVYAKVKHVFNSDFEKRRFRQVITDGQAAETHLEFGRQIAEQTATQKEKSKAISRARKSGINLRLDDPNAARRALGVQMMEEAGIL